MAATDLSRGILYAVIAFGSWGIAPLYFKLLKQVPSAELLSHRILWSMAALVLLVVVMRRLAALRGVFRNNKVMLRLVISGVLIAANWGLYLWAVLNGHVLQGSLGYYINPLLNVALGAIFLKELLTPRRKLAVAIAAAGVLLLVATGGEFPWVALSLALTFSIYGIVRKVTPIDPVTGLLFETLLATPVALIYLFWLGAQGPTTGFADHSTLLLLMGTGIVTTIPLLAFIAAARRLDYATLGICQYISPSLQFLLAVTLFGEAFTLNHAIAFGAIWTSLALYTSDLFRARTKQVA